MTENLDTFKQRFVGFMNRANQRTVEGCQVLAEAKASLERAEFKRLCKDLALDVRTIQRYLKIGNASRFKIKEVQEKLPASWTTLEQIANLPDALYDQALNDGIISPTVTRQQIIKFKESQGNSSSTSTATRSSEHSSKVPLVTIRFDKRMNDPMVAKEVLEELEDKVDDLRQTFGMYNIHFDSYGLVERLQATAEKSANKMPHGAAALVSQRERCLRLLARIARKVARLRSKQSKYSSSGNTKSRSWMMTEVRQCKPDEASVRTAFGELDLSLNVDECFNNPQKAQEFYDNLTYCQKHGIAV